jgi:hypothetical protein
MLVAAMILCAATVVGIGMYLIWRGRFVPALDYGNWIREGRIFRRLLAGDADAIYSVKRYPVPNAIVVVTLAAFDAMFGADVAGKTLFSISLLILVGGIIRLMWTTGGPSRAIAASLAMSLVLGRWFLLGSLSYFLGLGMLALFVSDMIRRDRRGVSMSPIVLASWFGVLYFTHFTILIAAVGIAIPFCIARGGIRNMGVVAKAVAPCVILAIWFFLGTYFGSHKAHSFGKIASVYEPALWQVWSIRLIPGDVFLTLAPLFSTDSGFPASARWATAYVTANVAWAIAMAAIAAGSILVGFRSRTTRAWASGGAACAVLLIVCGRELAHGEVGNRMIVPILWMGLACFAVRWSAAERPRTSLAIACACLAAIVVQSAILVIAANRIDPLSASDYARLSNSATRGEFCNRYRELFTSTGAIDAARGFRHQWLLPMMPVRRGVVSFIAMDQPRWSEIVPINEVSIIAGSSPDDCVNAP